MTRRLLLTLLLIAVVAPSLGGSVVVVRRAAAPSGVYIHDDFSTDTITSGAWVVEEASWNVAAGVLNHESGASGVLRYDTSDIGSDDGRACFQDDTASSYQGIKFRMDNTDGSRAYTVRTNAGSPIVWRHCALSSCTDLASATLGTTLQDGNCVCIQWSGTGASTTVNYWTLSNANCPSGESSTTATWTTNAIMSGTLTCDASCQSAISSNPSLDGGASYRYVGVYNGNSDATVVNEFWAWGE